MLHVPLSFFGLPARITSDRGVSRYVRGLLAIGIAALLLIAPLSLAPRSFTVSAEQVSGSKPTGLKHFVLYQNAAGEVVCRAATLAEANELDKVDTSTQRLQQINHLQSDRYAHRGSKANGAALSATNLTIILRATSQLNSNTAAKNAFIRAAQNWETLILSPITIYIDVDFGTTNSFDNNKPWDTNVLGSTGTPGASYPYQSVRTNLIAEANGEGNAAKQAIFNLLPATNVPTDLGNSSTTDVIDTNARAIGLLPPTAQPTDLAAQIAFNSNFAYDFDPTDNNGTITGTDFDAVATHEIGHALGFDSDAGQGSSLPAVWDLYRFRTGTTSSTFSTAQRIMTIGGSPDPLQFDFIPGNSELGLSTGGPAPGPNDGDGRQSSHWKHVSTCNISATKESGEPSHSPDNNQGGASVWYQWQAPVTSSVTITTAGSNFDTVLAVYTGPSVSSLTVAKQPDGTDAKNDDIPDVPGQPHNTTSSVTVNVTAGTIYKIAVDGYDNVGSGLAVGDIKLNWSEANCGLTPATVRLTTTDFPVNENTANGFVTVSVIREGDATSAASVNYATSDTSSLNASCSQVTGKASERCDYATSLGTLSWAAGEVGTKSFNIPIINDAWVEGTETLNVTLSNPIGVSLGTSTATVTILDNDSNPVVPNPIDGVNFFITEQYIDFLGRMPDAGGFTNWQNTLAPCPNGGFGENDNPNCDRIHVAAGFFQSDEFLNRGYWAFRFYMVSYNQRPTYAQFIPDMAQVGGPKSPAQEEASKIAFADAFVQRPEFTSRYPGLSGQALANALWQTAGLPGSPITVGGMTNGQILRTVVETSAALNKFLVDGTVAIQYFGFLRRDPDTIGYQNNLATLRSDPNNLRHMIFIFIYSTEYRGRFGTP